MEEVLVRPILLYLAALWHHHLCLTLPLPAPPGCPHAHSLLLDPRAHSRPFTPGSPWFWTFIAASRMRGRGEGQDLPSSLLESERSGGVGATAWTWKGGGCPEEEVMEEVEEVRAFFFAREAKEQERGWVCKEQSSVEPTLAMRREPWSDGIQQKVAPCQLPLPSPSSLPKKHLGPGEGFEGRRMELWFGWWERWGSRNIILTSLVFFWPAYLSVFMLPLRLWSLPEWFIEERK